MELPHIDLDSIRGLMKLMDEHRFDEIDLREEGKRLHLLRGGSAKAQPAPAMMVPAMMAAAPAAEIAEAPAAEGGLPEGVVVITSPMVGTFYRAPSPDSAPFVEERQQVEDETVLCLIEAMKVMNEIKAECAGELVKILVANGEAVEYGEPLFHVRVEA